MSTAHSLTPAALADVLGALPVRVSAVSVQTGVVPLEDYAGGRPTSAVCLAGDGHQGYGENVAFSAAEHARFAAGARDYLNAGAGAVGALIRPECPPYDRAALEAALIDLAMRQQGLTLAKAAGKTHAELRVVISFAACADPCARIRWWRAQGYGGAFKIDVEPTWDETTRTALAEFASMAASAVAILDFKGRGDERLAREMSALFPDVVFEDPPVGTVHPRTARDASLLDVPAVARTVARKEAVNLKAPRMGGPLALLRGLQVAVDAGVLAYVGGMFEVGVGRSQARRMAALFCGEAPNDLALLAQPLAGGSRQVIRLDAVGFGIETQPAAPAISSG